MKKHIIGLIVGLLALAAGLAGLVSLDSKISMPLLRGGTVIEEPQDGAPAITDAEAEAQRSAAAVRMAMASIDSIGDVTADKQDMVAAARAHYDALTDAEKAQVTNVDLLVAAEAKLADLELDQQAAQQKPEAAEDPAESGTAGALAAGDKATFTGGSVYASAAAGSAAATIDAPSACTVTYYVEGALHPYHLISDDGGGVYGWVDAASVKKG